jgi:hypothetical protein
MKPFRFSPIEDKTELLKALEYIHLESFRLCKKYLGYLLPIAGNIGIFCHYEDEFERLTEIRKELTDISINWNSKYFLLHTPIVIPAGNGIPETTYTYLYIRKPDASHPQVGDMDFYLEPNTYSELKQSVLSEKITKGVKIFDRPDLDLIELSDPETDVVAFVGSYNLPEITKVKSISWYGN